MRLREIYDNLGTFFQLRKNAAPPPRWQTMLASFYLGLLLYLAAHLSGLI